VHGQVVAAVEDQRLAVGPVQLGDRGAALDATGSVPDRGAVPVAAVGVLVDGLVPADRVIPPEGLWPATPPS